MSNEMMKRLLSPSLCRVAPVLRAHERMGMAATVVASAETDDRHAMSPSGVYVLDRSILEHIPAAGYQDIKEVLLPQLHKRVIAVGTYVGGESARLIRASRGCWTSGSFRGWRKRMPTRSWAGTEISTRSSPGPS